MSNNAVPVIDAEMQQFQDDLLQSVREFKAGKYACVTKIDSTGTAKELLTSPLKKPEVLQSAG